MTPSAVPLVVAQGVSATYTMQLTTPPAFGTTVTISLLDDGKTITSSTDALGRFTAATYDPMTHKELTPATVKFTSANWNIPITIKVDINTNFISPSPASRCRCSRRSRTRCPAFRDR